MTTIIYDQTGRILMTQSGDTGITDVFVVSHDIPDGFYAASVDPETHTVVLEEIPRTEEEKQNDAVLALTKATFQKSADNKEVSDTEIVQYKLLIKPWKIGEAVEPGNCRTYLDKVYRVREGQGHTTQEDWTPDKTPALWAVIDVEHAGTLEDPIPASRGMDYIYGKYYLDPEDSKTYLCERIGATPGEIINLQYLPHELIGQYFTVS